MPALLRVVSGSPLKSGGSPLLSHGGPRAGVASSPLDWEHPEGRGRECPTRLGTLGAEGVTSDWELPEYWIGPRLPPLRAQSLAVGSKGAQSWAPGKPGDKAGCWRCCCHSRGCQERRMPLAPQEGGARNHIPLIRSFPLLPLLPRGGVGMGFIAGVWGQDFTSLLALRVCSRLRA